MISVPNRQPLSSGNKVSQLLGLFSFLVLVLLSSSCELFKPISTDNKQDSSDKSRTDQQLDPIQSRRVYDPVTGTYVIVQNSPVEKMDTVQWRLISEYNAPPITEEGTAVFAPQPTAPTAGTNNNTGTFTPINQIGNAADGSRILNAYNINFLLPFLANRLDIGENGNNPKIDANSQWALHYYSGAQIALDELQNGSASLNISAQDTKADLNALKALQDKSPLRDAHLIFGPYMRNNVAAVGEQVRGKEQVMISPYSAAAAVSPENPNYIQVNPTLEVHCRNILSHAISTQNADQIVLVANPATKDRLSIFQAANKELKKDINAAPLAELIITDKNAKIAAYANYRNVVFILPVYEDESFVANFLRQVYEQTKSRNMFATVYGLPQWRNFEQIDFNYYEGCNVHISSSVFVDRLDPDVRRFREQFFARFKALPREEAFVGYDVTRYFVRMLQQHGTRFQYQLPRNPEKLLHTEFRFEAVLLPQEGSNNFENPRVDRWENNFVNILQFRDYQFRKVN